MTKFYRTPRLVTHIDDRRDSRRHPALPGVAFRPAGEILDLMSELDQPPAAGG